MNFQLRQRENTGKYINGSTFLLTLAVELQLYNVVKFLLVMRANPNLVDSYGRSPLLVAVATGDLSVVKILLKFGADEKIRDLYGNTVLHIAALSGNLPLIKFWV